MNSMTYLPLYSFASPPLSPSPNGAFEKIPDVLFGEGEEK
jgi:hypothetical protein